MRYIIGFLMAFALVILLIILLIHGNNKPKTATAGKPLYSYATTNSAVRFTVDGPVNAVSQHRQYRITVDSNDVTYEQLTGYDGQVVNTKLFANTNSAYTVFLYALKHAGFTLGDNNPNLRDERGYCSTGNRYIFELMEDGNDVQRYWSTSCGGTRTYLGLVSLTQQLFQAQVPSFGAVNSGYGL